MKIVQIIFLVFLISGFSFGQNLMLNGDFEQPILDATVPTGVPTGQMGFSIERAPDWNNLFNTCDLIHPDADFVGGLSNYPPHGGVGCGGMGYQTDPIYIEYCYGKTQTLQAGNTYLVSFWVSVASLTQGASFPFGAYISSDQPQETVAYISGVVPNVLKSFTTGGWQKMSFCFVAAQSGTHYLAFGAFNPLPNTISPMYPYVYLDDVEVTLIENNILPQPVITPAPSLICDNTPLVLNGAGSTNVQEYEWDVYRLYGPQETQVYNGPRTTGTPTTFDLLTSGVILQKGECYRAYLTAYNGCSDKTYVEFCVQDPTVYFVNSQLTVCENAPLNLEVTGDNGWTYTWSSGQSGQGLKNVTVLPTAPVASYTVNVVTDIGCTSTKTLNMNVNYANNLPPWMNGINGTGEYTIYVNQGDVVNFTSSLFNDHANELVETIVFPPNISPSTLFVVNYPTNGFGQFQFTADAGLGFMPDLPLGTYTFVVQTTDINACFNASAEYNFNVVVICPECEICIAYENRTPATTILPIETKVAKCITAGLNQVVETGDFSVAFIAGESIELGAFFEAGPGFTAEIDPQTCRNTCEDCCADWQGFTLDEVEEGRINTQEMIVGEPNFFSYWNAYDTDNPFCAFHAEEYYLLVEDADNNYYDVYEAHGYSTGCCDFQSVAINNQIPHSSIYWDGVGNIGTYDGVLLTYGGYRVTLTLIACGEEKKSWGWLSIRHTGKAPDFSSQDTTFFVDKTINSSLSIYPNPSSDFFNINYDKRSKITSIEVYDLKGLFVISPTLKENERVDVQCLPSGVYNIKIELEDGIIYRKFVKL